MTTAYPRSAHPLDHHVAATGQRAMVTTSHPLATATALNMLRRGGTAMDAYIAAAAVQVVVEPAMTSFGGQMGVNWFDPATGRTTLVGGMFGKPEAEDGNWDEAGADSGRPICVPGWLIGANAAWSRFGKLPWRDLFEPALDIARDGFTLDPHCWGWVWEYRFKLARFREGQGIWYPKGHLLNVGDRLVQPELAHTIAQIQADRDLEWFYTGEFARRYVATAQADGGRLTLADMANHLDNALVVESGPIGHYRGYDIHAPGGTLVALALEAAEHGDLRRLGLPTENPETLYRQMRLIEELWHQGLAEGAGGMSDFGRATGQPSPEQAATLWQRVIDLPPRPYDPISAGTNALVIVDPDGNVVHGSHSYSSVPFGNGHIVDGVVLSRGVGVYGQPTKIPRGLSTSLLLAKGGKPMLAVTSPSISVVTNILQNTMNVVDFGLTAAQSVRQPMFGAPWYPSRRSMIEGNFSEAHYRHLTSRGMGFKRVSPDECEMGSCHMITVDADGMSGVADPRRRGQAAGF